MQLLVYSGFVAVHGGHEFRYLLDVMPPSATPPLAHLGDDEVARLAAQWRLRAQRGEREAFGIAHTLEVECRRRTRESQMQPLPPEPVPRPWWKFWQTGAGPGDGPLYPT